METVKAGVYHIKFPLSRRGAMFAYHHSRDEEYIVAIKMPPLQCLLCYDHDAENLGVSGGCYGAHGGFLGLPVKSQSVPEDLRAGGSMSSLSTNASDGGANLTLQRPKLSLSKHSGAMQCSVPKDMHLMGSSTSATLGGRRTSEQHTAESRPLDHSVSTGGNINGNRRKSDGSSGNLSARSQQASASAESRARFHMATSHYERELCFHRASALRPHNNIILSNTRQLYMSVPAHWEDGEKPAIVMELAHASLQHWMFFLTHVEDRSSQDFYACRVRKWALHARVEDGPPNAAAVAREKASLEKGPQLWARVRLEVARRVVRCLIEGLRHIHLNLRFSHNKIRAPHVLLLIEERDQGAEGNPDTYVASRCTGSALSRRPHSSAAGSLCVKLAGFSGAEEFPSADSMSSDDMVNAMQASDLGFSCDMELYQQCATGEQLQRPTNRAVEERQKIQEKVSGDLLACGKLLHDLNQDPFLAEPDPQLTKIVQLLRGAAAPSKDDESPKLEANAPATAGLATSERRSKSPPNASTPEAGLNSPERLLPLWPEGLDDAVAAFLGQDGVLALDERDEYEREIDTKLLDVMEYLKAWVRWRERPDKHEYHQGRPTVKTIKLEERTLFKSIGAFFKGVLGRGKTN